MIKVRGGKSRSDMILNRLESGLLMYSDEQIADGYPECVTAAIELRRELDATECGARQMNLTDGAAELLAFLAYYWLDYYQNGAFDYDRFAQQEANNRAGLCTRILAELKTQGIIYNDGVRG